MVSLLSLEIDHSLAPGPRLDRHISLIGVSDDERSRIAVSKISRYADSVWDLGSEFPNLPPHTVRMRFELVSLNNGDNITMPGYESYLRSIKEYCYSLLVDPPSSHPKWSTCCIALKKGVRRLIRFMVDNGITRFSDLERHDFTSFLEMVAGASNKSGRPISDRTLRSRVSSISWLYEQSEKVSDGLKCWPFVDSPSESEWANECGEIKLPRNLRTTPEMPDSVAAQLLSTALLDLDLITTIREIRTKISTHHFHKKQTITLDAYGKKSYATIMRKPFPWGRYGLVSGCGVRALISRLYTACYIIISLLTGMRYHEVVHIRHGRINNWKMDRVTTADGSRNVYCIISSTNKLQADATEYSWQTVPIVERALEALEECFAKRHDAGNRLLFASALDGRRISANAINSNLNKYAVFHDIKHEGEIWKLATHQFRKKFARIMVRQGLGLVALQDQLKHYDIEMTKSYGDMNIYAELHEQKFELSREKYKELLGSQQPIIGGGTPEILQYRKEFMGMNAHDKEEFLDRLPSKALVEQVDDGLCMFRPSKALCGGDKSNCRPADCNNAILPAASVRKTLIWRKNENLRMLKYFKGSYLKSAHIKTRLAELEKLITQLNALEAK